MCNINDGLSVLAKALLALVASASAKAGIPLVAPAAAYAPLAYARAPIAVAQTAQFAYGAPITALNGECTTPERTVD